MAMRGRLSALLLLPLLLGCSHVSITRVTPEHPYERGLRFYRPWPYLLVTVDRNEVTTAQVVYLPDLSEEYVIEPKVRLGSVEVKATFEQGWQLTSLGASADPQVADTIDAVSGLIGAASSVGAAPAGAASAFPLAPGLYRLTYAEGHVSGAEPVLSAPR